MISSLTWIRKGAAQQVPDRFQLTDQEYARIAGQIGAEVDEARLGLAEAESAAAAGGEGEGADVMMVDEGEEAKPKAEKMNQDDELAEYNLDNYDEEEDEGEKDIPIFGNVKGLTYHGSNAEDPYVVVKDEEDEEEELEEMHIMPTDNLLLAAKTEDEISHLEVYVYEEEEDNVYVHHDIMLPSFPLCLEWLDFPVGRKMGKQERGNFVAIGTFDPEVEIWDLDTVDTVYPECILGGAPNPSRMGPAPIKKKKAGPARTSKNPNPERHVDAVMSIAWNKNHRHMIATGSADSTVKLWDLQKPETALRSFNVHKNKVQAVAWNGAEPTVLLTGGYDKKACVFDTRAPAGVVEWKLSADVECLKWDPFHPERFLASTEDGIVKAFDVRSATRDPLWTLHAHDAAVSALDVSPLLDGLIVTGSTDKQVKLWNVKEGKPSCLSSRDLGLGKVFATNFSADSPYILAVAGSKGKLLVWNMEDNAGVRKAFPPAQHTSAPATKRKEITTVESDDEEDEDEDEAEDAGLGMDEDGDEDAWEEEEDEDGDHV
ncbi:hypothetical protein HK104_008144 [Borealophlyctis nickersoniae]|nr:hypothetical protein HK104_008144 [Borealophlyctis nickersoniae]